MLLSSLHHSIIFRTSHIIYFIRYPHNLGSTFFTDFRSFDTRAVFWIFQISILSLMFPAISPDLWNFYKCTFLLPFLVEVLNYQILSSL